MGGLSPPSQAHFSPILSDVMCTSNILVQLALHANLGLCAAQLSIAVILILLLSQQKDLDAFRNLSAHPYDNGDLPSIFRDKFKYTRTMPIDR